MADSFSVMVVINACVTLLNKRCEFKVNGLAKKLLPGNYLTVICLTIVELFVPVISMKYRPLSNAETSILVDN